MSVNVIGQRMDFYAMIHACWLIAVLYRRRRKAIAEIWPKYCCFLACIITFQYFICIGIPPAPCRGEQALPETSCSCRQPSCHGPLGQGQGRGVLTLLFTTSLPADYPWRFKGASFNDNIIKWLYFPDFIVRPNPVFLVCKCCSHGAAEHWGLVFPLVILLCALCISTPASSNTLCDHVKACLDALIPQVLNGFYLPYYICKINK